MADVFLTLVAKVLFHLRLGRILESFFLLFLASEGVIVEDLVDGL